MVDSASIEVNRRARRAKTDRLDGDKLLAMLLRYAGGERRVWSVVRVPTLEQEDERRVHRELGRLGHERTAHISRIRSLLVLHNLRVKYVGGRLWQRFWISHAQELAPRVRAEIEREIERLSLVQKQMHTIEAEQRQAVGANSETQVAQLVRLRAIGVSSGWGVGEGAIWLAGLSQPARGGGLPGAGALALRQRAERDRARHFQGR